jgi:GTPase KRas protein
VYSITQRSSFVRLERYYQDMMRTKRGQPKFILVGNKYDMQQRREVSYGEGSAQATKWGCPFFETSAKTRHNVEEAFTNIVRALRQSDASKPESTPGPTGGRPPKPAKSGKSSIWSKCVVV